MVYYKDNPNLENLKTVKTVKGDIEYRRNTKYIREQYYTIGRDCFFIDEKWYRYDNKNIAFDHENNCYFLLNHPKFEVIYGIVLIDGKLTKGYFSKNPYNNVNTRSNEFGRMVAINSKILLERGWFEDLGENIYYDKNEMGNASYLLRTKIRNEKTYTDRGYNIEDNKDYNEKLINYNNYPIKISKKAYQMSKYLGNITFGMEIELHAGNISNNLKNRYGVVVCRDGSLHGGAELVTVPKNGAKGLQSTVDLCNELKNRTRVELDCSFHIHLGNFNTDKLTIIALYKLARNIQDELFTMFPYYKVVPDGIKQKNYTKKLLKLNIGTLKDNSKEAYKLYILDSWNKLFNFYSEGLITQRDFDKKSKQHPLKRKWEQKNRYFYLNFMNLFFSHRNTLEMRFN